ncbi:MAG: hypothetical protein HYZ08_00455 [Candidatus Kerfeldbacteria bacterium]|nr:hypothetical protein [Candidatus Kerfeldbacteria bacterium]
MHSDLNLELILKIALSAFRMPFVPKLLKNEEEYRGISTSSEAVAGQTVPKWPEDYF